MIVHCSWCKKFMYEKDGGEGISHGICPTCAAKLWDGVHVRRKGGRTVGEVVRALPSSLMVLWPGEEHALLENPDALEVCKRQG